MKSFALATLAAVAVAQTDADLALVFADVKNDLTIANMMNVLGDNESAATATAGIADMLTAQFMSFSAELPEVCEGGAACRGDIATDVRLVISQQWQITLQNILTQFENVVLKSENIMHIAYTAARECAPECPCDYIITEYTDVMRLQTEIYQEITLLEEQLVFLEEEQTKIVEECPDYVLIDGHYYYGNTTAMCWVNGEEVPCDGWDASDDGWTTTGSGGTYSYEETVGGEQTVYYEDEWDGVVTEEMEMYDVQYTEQPY